ncbi:MAG TPA: MFS transporter, partial [Ilumatobacteraceae bacterium]
MARTRHAVVGITAAVGTTLMGTGLLGSLLGVRAKRAGISAAVMGVAMAMYYVGFLAGIPLMNRILERTSRRRLFACSTSLMAVAALSYGLVVDPAAWLGFRFITGFGLAGCYLVVETWLNDLAHNDIRGKVIGFYVAMGAGGLAVGQLVLALTNPSRWTSFLVAAAITAVAWTPLVFVRHGVAAQYRRAGSMTLSEVARAVPSGVVGFIMVGVTQGCMLTMASVYAARAGLDARHVGFFVGAITAGGVVLQVPVGAIADRVSRRAV